CLTLYATNLCFFHTSVTLRQGVEYLISSARYHGLRQFCKNPLCDLIVTVALQIVCIVRFVLSINSSSASSFSGPPDACLSSHTVICVPRSNCLYIFIFTL
uniref:Uncharacterized protein n=1 Tax=Scophthalmus maximus TaxID=52904 RepID=A0A8D2ZQ50_SCOMX